MALEKSMLENLLGQDLSRLETLIPSRILRYILPNEHPNRILHSREINIFVIDSPLQSNPPDASVRAMIIHPGLESDWHYSTEVGQLQLLRPRAAQISRFVLIGNKASSLRPENFNRLPNYFQERATLEANLIPFVRALCPGDLFVFPEMDINIFLHDDVTISRTVLAIREGDLVGDILIEDIQRDNGRMFRNLRFKRNPIFIQTPMTLVPRVSTDGLMPDIRVLCKYSLVSMVTSLAIIARDGVFRYRCPRALCLGVGGGSLISFLSFVLKFEVVGVEVDEAVLRAAANFFGLEDRDSVRLFVGDGIRLMEKLASYHGIEDLSDFKEFKSLKLFKVDKDLDPKFDVIMVDLDSRDVQVRSYPPFEFVENSVFRNAKSILNRGGILVINVHAPDNTFYTTLLTELKRVFQELRQIKVAAVNGGNSPNHFILIAAASPLHNSFFLTKLRSVIPKDYRGLIENVNIP